PFRVHGEHRVQRAAVVDGSGGRHARCRRQHGPGRLDHDDRGDAEGGRPEHSRVPPAARAGDHRRDDHPAADDPAGLQHPLLRRLPGHHHDLDHDQLHEHHDDRAADHHDDQLHEHHDDRAADHHDDQLHEHHDDGPPDDNHLLHQHLDDHLDRADDDDLEHHDHVRVDD